jgi:hypothetical protein
VIAKQTEDDRTKGDEIPPEVDEVWDVAVSNGPNSGRKAGPRDQEIKNEFLRKIDHISKLTP